MLQGNIDAAEEAPSERAHVFTEVDGEARELVLDSVRASWKDYYQNVADALNKGAELAVSARSVRRVIAIFDAAMQSAREGRSVPVQI